MSKYETYIAVECFKVTYLNFWRKINTKFKHCTFQMHLLSEKLTDIIFLRNYLYLKKESYFVQNSFVKNEYY